MKNKRKWKKRTCQLFLGLLSIILLVSVEQGSSQTGRITEIDDSGNSGYIVVKGIVSEGSLWLGCTLFPDQGYRERDKDPVQVRRKFETRFECASILVNNPSRIAHGETDIPYAVCLWGKKVSKRQCARQNNGEPCKYCLKNGYHMEDRIDRRTGEWTPSNAHFSNSQPDLP